MFRPIHGKEGVFEMKPQHLYWNGEPKVCMTENPVCNEKAVWLVEYDSEYFFVCKKHYLTWEKDMGC